MVYEEVELRGHVLDSLTLSKVLDHITGSGGWYEIKELQVGTAKEEPSYARLRVGTRTRRQLQELLGGLSLLGVRPLPVTEAAVKKVTRNGVAPEDFAVSTNLPTEIFIKGRWIPVSGEEMDCAIVVSPSGRSARCVPLAELRRGDLVVCGREGIRTASYKEEQNRGPREAFAFMGSAVSPERPHRSVIAQLAERMRRVRQEGGKILFVAGPAVVHSGGAPFLEALVLEGWVDVFFSGNALAVHDIEYALFGTSLGVRLADGLHVPAGHEHHVRAINLVRREGSIRRVIKKGILQSGIMHALVTRKVPFVLAGSVRDDGPLPEVVTDILVAQKLMRQNLKGVSVAVMVATALHSIATGNLLSSRVHTVVVDLSPHRLTELVDRGTAHAVGLAMDAASFLEGLSRELQVNVPGKQPVLQQG